MVFSCNSPFNIYLKNNFFLINKTNWINKSNIPKRKKKHSIGTKKNGSSKVPSAKTLLPITLQAIAHPNEIKKGNNSKQWLVCCVD